MAQSNDKRMIIHVNSGTGMELQDGKIAIPLDKIREVTFEGLASDSIFPTPSEAKAIRFQFKDNSSSVTRSRRKEAPALENRRYGVFAHYKKNDEEVQLMNNTEVEFLDNEWTYYSIKYWPRNEQEEGIPTSFYAYSPYSNANGFIRASNETGEPLLEYSSTNPMDDAGDLLYGSLLNATEKTNDGLAIIQSKHALARFDFSAVAAIDNMDSNTKVTIRSIKINGLPQTGTFNLKNQQWTNLSIPSEGFTINGNKLSPDIRDTGEDYVNLPTGVLPVEQSIATSPCLFLPTDETQDISFTVEYFITTPDPILQHVRIQNEYRKSLRFRVNAGCRYKVKFVLNLTSMGVNVTGDSEWDDISSTVLTR